MTSRDFVYFLQGLFELSNPTTLDAKQVDLIRRHLALVFKHEIDPSAGPPEHQKELDAIHSPPPNVSLEDVKKLVDEQMSKKRPKLGGYGPGGTMIRC